MAFFAVLLVAAQGPAASPARAASTPWEEHAGGAVRLVTAGPADAQGRLRGVLDIYLKPGWKTYWRDPGSAGVPPTLTVAGGAVGADLHFPTPKRHDDGYGAWAGYGSSVALPITFTLAENGPPIDASVFLGVCQTICVPVQAGFSLDPDAGDEAEDIASVDAAFARLPGPARPGFEVIARGMKPETLLLEAKLPPGTAPLDLFLAGSELGIGFGTPAIGNENGNWTIVVPARGLPAKPATIPYTLVTSTGAIAGELRLQP